MALVRSGSRSNHYLWEARFNDVDRSHCALAVVKLDTNFNPEEVQHPVLAKLQRSDLSDWLLLVMCVRCQGALTIDMSVTSDARAFHADQFHGYTFTDSTSARRACSNRCNDFSTIPYM